MYLNWKSLTARMNLRFFINDMLGGALIHVRMGFELEQEVENINQEEYLRSLVSAPFAWLSF